MNIWRITLFMVLCTIHYQYGQANKSYYDLQFINIQSSLPLTHVYVKVGSQTAFSDKSGRVNFSLPSGKSYTVTAHLIGYKDTTFVLSNRPGRHVLKLFMRRRSEVLAEAQVVAAPINNAKDVMHREVLQNSINYKELGSIPLIGGEPDIVKGLKQLPGVQTGLPGGADLYVRGGDVYHNAMHVEGVPIFNNNHGYGYLSPFAPDGVSTMQFYKQGVPARFGNNLSSVMNVNLRQAATDKINGGFALGPASLRGNIGIPLKKDTSGLFLAGRLFTLGLAKELASFYTPDPEALPFFNFQDGSLKAYYHLNDSTVLDVFGYWSGDQTDYEQWGTPFTYQYATKVSAYAGGLRLRKQKGNVKQLHQLYVSGYEFKVNRNFAKATLRSLRANEDSLFQNKNRLLQMGYRNQWNGSINATRWELGSDLRIFHQQMPLIKKVKPGNIAETTDNGSVTRWSPALFAQASHPFDSLLTLMAGLRLAYFQPSERSDIIALPHATLQRTLSKKWTVFAAFDRTASIIQRYRNANFGSSLDIPTLSNTKLPYSTQLQYSTGIVHARKHWRAHISLFFRDMKHIADRNYRKPVLVYGNQDQIPTTDISEGLLSVNGESYGLEANGNFQVGIFSGQLSYTWSKSLRQADFVNRGKAYPFEFNRDHYLSGKVKIRFKKNNINKVTELGLAYTYGTGNYTQFGFQEQINPVIDRITTGLVEQRNNVQLPALSHLDLLINFIHERDNGNLRIFSISIFNVLATKIITQYEDKRFDNKGNLIGTEANGPFAVIPSINYELRF